VKQDEDAAAAKEAAEEQRMQEADAERRVRALRGLPVEQIALDEDSVSGGARAEKVGGSSRHKRRRIEGEDDTERDIRYARECQLSKPIDNKPQIQRCKTSDAPLVDHSGHINLFPVEALSRNGPKNPEAEAELAAKKREYEDQYTMRFSNAAGFKQAIGQKPWYHSTGESTIDGSEPVSKDKWGNEDPRRKSRQQMRIAAEDPLSMIQKGVKDFRKVEEERRKWKEERDREMEEIAKAERRRARKRVKSNDDELEGFSLDHDERSSSRRHDVHRRRDEGHEHHEKRHRHSRTERDDKDSNGRRHREKSKDVGGWRAGPGGRYSTQFAEVRS
jgi:hypothetical protein